MSLADALKKIWHDPVWSKVIAAGVLGLLGWLTYRWRLWAALRDEIVAAWTFLGSTSPVRHWVLGLLTVVMMVAVATAVLILWIVLSGRSRPPAPDWRAYTTDVFYDLRWRWRYEDGRIGGLSPFCPRCGYALVPEDWGMNLHFQCDKCPREYTVRQSWHSLLSKVERLVYQKLSSGEWKAVADAADTKTE